MKKINDIKFQLVSLAFFVIYFIGSFFPWFSSPGVKSIDGTLIFSALFPIGIVSVILFIVLNVISIIKIDKLYIHITNILLLTILIILSLKLLIKWGGFSEFLCFNFYISNLSIVISLIFYILYLYKKQSIK